MYIRFHTQLLCILVGVLWSANCFAKTNPHDSSNDLRAAAPAVSPEVQPDRAAPPGLIPAVPIVSQAQLLSLVHQANEELYSNLQSFVCSEVMERFKGRISGESSRQIDRVSAKVSFENGVEHYSEIHQNDRERYSIATINGAWSTGEFGTLLRQTQALLETQQVAFRNYAELDGTPAAVFSFDVDEQDTPWDLEVAGAHYAIPFHTDLWVSRLTGQILKLERVSTKVPPTVGISEIRWNVKLQPVQFNDKTWLLPHTGEYMVLYEESGRREWNELTFSNYHRYGSEVAVRFQ